VQVAQATQPSGTNRPCGLASPALDCQKSTSNTTHAGTPDRSFQLPTTKALSVQFEFEFELLRQRRNPLVGGNSARVTPVPIPNTVVKPRCADGTAREIGWESTSSPANSCTTQHRPDSQLESQGGFALGRPALTRLGSERGGRACGARVCWDPILIMICNDTRKLRSKWRRADRPGVTLLTLFNARRATKS
jgi:hypothetical protein